jgi:hypothetical protein
MKKLILIIFAATQALVGLAQKLNPAIETNEQLITIRQELKESDSLMKKGIFTDDDTGKDYFTGYSYKTLYDWDQYFEAIIQTYMGWPSTYIKNGVTIFLDHQQPSGHIARSVPSNQYHDPEHVKPFLAQTALLVFDQYSDEKWMTESYFQKLKKYLDYWLYDMDGNDNGLSEWMSAPHTGMDNQHERAGWWKDRISEGVDLNSYLVKEMRAFAEISKRLGKDKISKEYLALAEKRKQTIRELLWNEEDGFFYDLQYSETGFGSARSDFTKGGGAGLIGVRSVAGFTPLWAGVATPEQAERMVHDYLLNPKEFWTDYPIPALAISEPGHSKEKLLSDLGCSWRANTWIPTNYMVYHGLKDYGYEDIARLLAVRTDQLMRKAGIREYYTSDGSGVGLNPFWGWSVLGHFFLFEENFPQDITKSME